MFVIVDHLQIEDHSELELSKVVFHEDHLKLREIISHERVKLKPVLENHMGEAFQISDLADNVEEIVIPLIVVSIDDKIPCLGQVLDDIPGLSAASLSVEHDVIVGCDLIMQTDCVGLLCSSIHLVVFLLQRLQQQLALCFEETIITCLLEEDNT